MTTTKLYALLLFFTIIQISTSAGINSIQSSADTTSLILKSSNKDAIILDENNDIAITGLKASFINFSISKKLKFKALNGDGVKRFSNFILPETFDPTYISHYPKDRNYTYTFSNLKCKYFRGRIIKKNGETIDANIKLTINPIKMVMVDKNIYGNFQNYSYQISNMEVGDEVSIEYNYSITYIDNFGLLSSFRIFFNGDVPKVNYQLTLSHQSNLNIDIFFKNNAEPTNTTNQDNLKIYNWTKSNLPGCIHEEGSIPYLSLPYVLFSIKPLEMLYTLPYSFDEKFVPIYAYFSYQREKNQMGIAKSIAQHVNTKQLALFEDYLIDETKEIKGDSLNYQKLMKIQNNIADNFTFANDTNYFKKIDIREPKIGDEIKGNILRDISRYDMYVAIILKLDLSYYTTYACDNRTGEVNNEYFTPMFSDDFLFSAVLKNNTVQYIYPKRSQFGYYLNEMPFYFENSKVMLVSLDDYRNYKSAINQAPRQLKLPNSSINDNVRKTNILVKINTDSLSAVFEAKINLTGQYSTLTRGLYQCNYSDETINKLYNKKIWELNNKVQLISRGINVTNKEFPFPAVVNAHYSANNLVSKNGDAYSINIKNWFNYIIYSGIDTANRQLDFYPDFLGKDSYVYYIQFDKNIKLLNTLKIVEIKNEFGELSISASQAAPDAIKISSLFVTKKNKITPDKIKTVKTIYDKIMELNNCLLTFKIE